MHSSQNRLPRKWDSLYLARRSILFFLALGFLIWASWGYRIPTPDLRWTVATAGLGLALWGATLGTAWEVAGGWIALAVIGQACFLQLIDAGAGIRLQLFYSWDVVLRSVRLVFLIAVVFQAGIVLWGLRKRWPAWRLPMRRLFTWSQAAVFGLFLVFSAVTMAPSFVQALVYGGFASKVVIYASKLALALLILAAGTLNLVLAAATIPDGAWQHFVARWTGGGRSRLPLWCAAWVFLVSSAFSLLVFERLPHVPDEVAYLFHAKYFAAGRLYLPAPPDPHAFSCGLAWVHNGKWYSAQLPGWPAVLAIGARLGVPWLVNPLLGALAILLAYEFVRRLYDEKMARGAILLLAFSPWLLVMSATMMGHPASLVFTLAALLGVQLAREHGSLLAAALAGLSLGALADTRPLEALVIGLAAGIWWLAVGWRRLRLVAVLTACILGAVTLGLQFAYNKAVTGDPKTLPFEIMVDATAYKGANRVGFGRDVGNLGWAHLDPLPGHGPIDVAVNTNQNLYMLNFETFGWACGSMLFVILLLVWRPQRRDFLMWGVCLAIWCGMSFYWFSGGPDFGARYWYQMIVPLAVLTLRGAQEFAARWQQSEAGPAPLPSHRIWAFIALASLLGFVNLAPWRSLDKYRNYRGVSGDIRKLAWEYHFGRSIVFVRAEGALLPWASSEYASAFSLNPPTLAVDAAGTIYARDLGPESRRRVRQFYADRPAWTIGCPAATGDGFRVIEGPLPPLNATSGQNGPAPKPPAEKQQ